MLLMGGLSTGLVSNPSRASIEAQTEKVKAALVRGESFDSGKPFSPGEFQSSNAWSLQLFPSCTFSGNITLAILTFNTELLVFLEITLAKWQTCPSSSWCLTPCSLGSSCPARAADQPASPSTLASHLCQQWQASRCDGGIQVTEGCPSISSHSFCVFPACCVSSLPSPFSLNWRILIQLLTKRTWLAKNSPCLSCLRHPLIFFLYKVLKSKVSPSTLRAGGNSHP